MNFKIFLISLSLIALFKLSTGFHPGLLPFNPTEDRTHYEITECAIYRVTYDLLKTLYLDKLTESAPVVDQGKCKKAEAQMKKVFKQLKLDFRSYSKIIKKIPESNKNVDLNEGSVKSAHFDNEEFMDSSQRILKFKFLSILSIQQDQNFESAREYFGCFLHTLQDFYSHTNWVEFEPNKPNKNLGAYKIIGEVADRTERTCISCEKLSGCEDNILSAFTEKKILTSGYFSTILSTILFDESKPIGKCSHGGFLDTTSGLDAVGGINKDTVGSNHGSLHKIAAHLAEIATYNILKDFWATIGDANFMDFLGISGTSVAIVIDTTGSMEKEIESAKQTAIKLSLMVKRFNYILSPFNDPTWGPLSKTKNPDEFVKLISKLRADGGGDIPELFYHGLLDALLASEPNSPVYTFTDAPAKDYELQETCIALAYAKNIQINNILTYELYNQKVINTMDDYNTLSVLTGGINLKISKSALANVSNVIESEIDLEQTQLLTMANADYNSAGLYNYTFNVDSTVSSINIYLTTKQLAINQNTFSVIDPDNNKITAFKYLLKEQYSIVLSIEQPKFGLWQFRLNSDKFDFKVIGLSNVSLTTYLNLNNQNDIHPGFVSLSGSPIKGSTIILSGYIENLDYDLKEASLALINAKNELIKVYKIDSIDSNQFSAEIITPNEPFRVKLSGTFLNTNLIERVNPILYAPNEVDIKINRDENYLTMIPGQKFNLAYVLSNNANYDVKAKVNIKDSLNSFQNYERYFDLSANQIMEVTATFNIPLSLRNNSIVAQMNAISLSVSSSYASANSYSASNHELVYAIVQNANVSFDHNPTCVIVNETRTSICPFINDCSHEVFWGGYLFINDTGAGVSSVNALKNFDVSSSSVLEFNSTKPIVYGSKAPIYLNLRADCCSQDFEIVVSDIYGNIGKCAFQSYRIIYETVNSSNELKVSYFSLFVLGIVLLFV